jgi:hypothetical protein
VRCEEEYAKLRYAFNNTITPSIDQDLLKKVQAMEWLK